MQDQWEFKACKRSVQQCASLSTPCCLVLLSCSKITTSSHWKRAGQSDQPFVLFINQWNTKGKKHQQPMIHITLWAGQFCCQTKCTLLLAATATDELVIGAMGLRCQPGATVAPVRVWVRTFVATLSLVSRNLSTGSIKLWHKMNLQDFKLPSLVFMCRLLPLMFYKEPDIFQRQ